MRLNPPKKIVFWISLAFTALGLLTYFSMILLPYMFLPYLAFWFAFVGALLLILGNTVKGF
jgi:hypothetical protein